MATSRSAKELRGAQERLQQARESGNITEREYETLTTFWKTEKGNLKDSTIANYLNRLVRFARRTEPEIGRMDADELNDVLREFQRGTHPAIKDDGIIIKNHISALSKLARVVDSDADPDEIGIESDYNGRELTADDLLYPGEVDALFAAARRQNIRNVALMALTLATGQRADAVRTLRLKHITEDGPAMEVSLNREEGDLKGASGSRPVLWAKSYIRPWLDAHPHRDNPEAALFPAKNRGHGSEAGADTYKTEPLGHRQMYSIVSDAADAAGLDKNVYPHLLRHSAITRMVQRGLSQQNIKQIAGWSQDSSEFETYVNLKDNLANDSVREQLGYPTSESGTVIVGQPSLQTCETCQSRLPDDRDRCPNCGEAVTYAADDEPEEPATPDPEELVKDMDKDEKLELIDALRDEIRG